MLKQIVSRPNPVELVLSFCFDTVEDFVAEYADCIQQSGMRIRSHDAKTEGAHVYLRFGLLDGTTLVAGMGKVVRVESEPSALFVECQEFDSDAHNLIEAIVRRRQLVNG